MNANRRSFLTGLTALVGAAALPMAAKAAAPAPFTQAELTTFMVRIAEETDPQMVAQAIAAALPAMGQKLLIQRPPTSS